MMRVLYPAPRGRNLNFSTSVIKRRVSCARLGVLNDVCTLYCTLLLAPRGRNFSTSAIKRHVSCVFAQDQYQHILNTLPVQYSSLLEYFIPDVLHKHNNNCSYSTLVHKSFSLCRYTYCTVPVHTLLTIGLLRLDYCTFTSLGYYIPVQGYQGWAQHAVGWSLLLALISTRV